MPTGPVAKATDKIVAVCTHVLLIPSPGGPVPTPTPMPYNGIINSNTSPNVLIGGLPAATVGSMATNTPPHIPAGGPFANPLAAGGLGTISMGSTSVLINNKPAARAGDQATICSDVGNPGLVVAVGTVIAGG